MKEKKVPAGPVSATEDNELAIRVAEGDREAFSILASRYTAMLRGYVKTICANPADAEDICQESLRKAYTSIHSFKSQYRFKSWLFSIAHNTAIDHLRRKNTFSTVKLGEEDEAAGGHDEVEISPEDSMIDDQSYDLFIRSISCLPEKYRHAVELRLLHNYAYTEIAEELGLPLNTVRTRLRRAKMLLKKMMEI